MNKIILMFVAVVLLSSCVSNTPNVIGVTTDQNNVRVSFDSGEAIHLDHEAVLDIIQRAAEYGGGFFLPADRGVWIDSDTIAWQGRMIAVFDHAACRLGNLYVFNNSTGTFECIGLEELDRIPWIE